MNILNDSIVCADRAQELAAELMRHVLDDMQERAQDGTLILLDDDGNAHTISPMKEDNTEHDQPMTARDKLEKQLRRADNHAQQLNAEHEQRRECEVEFRNNCMYVVPQENGEQDE